MNKQHVFNLLSVVLALGWMESSQAEPVWVYTEMKNGCSDAADLEQLKEDQLEQEKSSLATLGIPVISAETNLRVSAGALPDYAPCRSVDRVLKCFMIDASYLVKALRAGFKESVGRWKDCGRAPQKRRVH